MSHKSGVEDQNDIEHVAASTPIVQVALDTPLDRLFDYLAPDATLEDLGRRVRVPFGRVGQGARAPREQVGVIVALLDVSEHDPDKLKPVLAIDRTLPPLPADILDLARFASGYYQHPLGPTLLALLPPALKREKFRSPVPDAYALTEAGRTFCAAISPRAPMQTRLAEVLREGPAPARALAEFKTLLRDWLKRGLIQPSLVRLEAEAGDAPLPLTVAQQVVTAQVLDAPPGFQPWLLHGITGSGKTEVYLRLIAAQLEAGRQVLVLAPEIHLTPQLTERFRRRFPGHRLVSLHSGLADGERLAGWLDCLNGRADIVLGTRLAVFTPLPRLGLILVDEEHDASYKQIEGLRYSARDVAVWRARQRDIPVLLGSATPALESWRNAQLERYRLLSMPERAHPEAAPPTIGLIDSRTDKPRQGLTEALLSRLRENLERGEQSLVFINRRGYAPTLYCQGCGHIFDCPRCSAHLVLHRHRHGYDLRCHHCGLGSRPPDACPSCGAFDMKPVGQGTQKVEEALAEMFPAARILRIDRDTTARKGSFAAMREQIEARQVDILVGTQIVAKGHDFPNLTLVGVVGADTALMSPDFRASERLFAQLMQVSGRAGRAEKPGRVLIQTDFPRHPLYAALLRHDYPGFARAALAERRSAEFPPFVHQALLRAEAAGMTEALAFLRLARDMGDAVAGAENVTLFDPVPALMARIARRERAQLLLQAASRSALQNFLQDWVAQLRRTTGAAVKGVKWTLDVDPLDL